LGDLNAPSALVVPIAGVAHEWLVLSGPTETRLLDKHARVLGPVCTQYRRARRDVDQAVNELAERYEEINLLYTIGEILGRTVKLDVAAKTILTEISETVGARSAAILVHDRESDILRAVAALGVDHRALPVVTSADLFSPAARAFRDRMPLVIGPDDAVSEAETPYRRGELLAAPILWASGDGAPPLGVLMLSDRRSRHGFTAGDQKLVAAIASQIGTAIQNARLVRASVDQQRLAHEMQLAHDLQMKLLPKPSVVAPDATVAARVVPADEVGGDFYNLIRLAPGRVGAMIGDVSSHGYRAALIMALALSAHAIHAQRTDDPGEVLGGLVESLRDELESTEMFITAFYAVIDIAAGTLRYANAGHPHAFRVDGKGFAERLSATSAPLGMTEGAPPLAERPWVAGEDLLVLFTDGIADARNRKGIRLGEPKILDLVTEYRTEHPKTIVERVFEALRKHAGEGAQKDDLTLVVLRA
jgi:sigma-B regulation protein RsbU (phosphoserine phosphatase)